MHKRTLPGVFGLHMALRRRLRLTGDREAWADEVAIDFPSVSRLVARARETFLDEENAPRTLAADVVLTPAEAWEGGQLPVSVTRRFACPACEGRGERWLEPCQPCAGEGECTSRQDMVVTIPPNVPDGEHLRVESDRGDAAVYVTVHVGHALNWTR